MSIIYQPVLQVIEEVYASEMHKNFLLQLIL